MARTITIPLITFKDTFLREMIFREYFKEYLVILRTMYTMYIRCYTPLYSGVKPDTMIFIKYQHKNYNDIFVDDNFRLRQLQQELMVSHPLSTSTQPSTAFS